MNDFNTKREEFLRKISKLASSSGLPVPDIKVRQLPTPGIILPEGIDPETARKIMKVYNEVFMQ